MDFWLGLMLNAGSGPELSGSARSVESRIFWMGLVIGPIAGSDPVAHTVDIRDERSRRLILTVTIKA